MDFYIGLDVSLASTAICVVSAQGKVVKDMVEATAIKTAPDLPRPGAGYTVSSGDAHPAARKPVSQYLPSAP